MGGFGESDEPVGIAGGVVDSGTCGIDEGVNEKWGEGDWWDEEKNNHANEEGTGAI